MVSALAELALAYYHAPLRYRHLSDMTRPLPRGFEERLTELGAALASSRIDETAARLSTTPNELEQAARFFVRHVLLDPAADYYRCLGLSRSAPSEAVRSHYLLLIRMFHPDRLAKASEADLAYASRINAAYHTLRDHGARRSYDHELPKAAPRHGTGDPADFFQPSAALPVTGSAPLWDRMTIGLRRPRVVIPLGLAVALIAAFLIFQQLRVKPTVRLFTADGARHEEIVPRYLARGSISGSAGTTHADPPQDQAHPSPGGNADRAPRYDTPRGDLRNPAEGSTTADLARLDGELGASPPAPAAADADHALRPAQPAARHSATVAAPRPRSETAATSPQERHEPVRQQRRESAGPPPADGTSLQTADTGRASRGPQDSRRIQKPRPVAVESIQGPGTALPPAAPASASTTTSTTTSASASASASAEASSRPSLSARGQQLVARLESAYRRGDADGFAALFTDGARTNEGAGRAFIRRLYAGFFERASACRLSIRNLHWQAAPAGGLVAQGRITVSNRYRGSNDWHHSSGRIRLELAEQAAGGYRIAQMFYDLD